MHMLQQDALLLETLGQEEMAATRALWSEGSSAVVVRESDELGQIYTEMCRSTTCLLNAVLGGNATSYPVGWHAVISRQPPWPLKSAGLKRNPEKGKHLGLHAPEAPHSIALARSIRLVNKPNVADAACVSRCALGTCGFETNGSP